MLKYLEKYLSNIKTYKCSYGCDAYLCASYYGKLDIMKYLEKEYNWDIRVKNRNETDAYLMVCMQLEIMKYLEK